MMGIASHTKYPARQANDGLHVTPSEENSRELTNNRGENSKYDSRGQNRGVFASKPLRGSPTYDF